MSSKENLMTPKWEMKYETGIFEIDLQHKNFLALIKKVELIETGILKQMTIDDVLEEIIFYARFHFRSEENLMKEFNYPELAQHTEKHKLLSNNLLQEVSNLMVHPDDIAHLHHYLINWLLDHILEEDKKLSSHLKNVI
ncbi:MAG: hemerythrin family protein [Melioribacteraceae bacterium]|nr:hemerythrin family protein [Melioribacteraceae bacterium]